MKAPEIKFIPALILMMVSLTLPISLAAAPASANDHKAKIFRLEGDVKIMKAGTTEWQAAQKDMLIEAGDQVLTGSTSHVEIVYDDNFLNIARINEKTKAEFRSIEPTDLHLEDGAIFSVLDGLSGSSYQVSTPTAVAAVRGTHFDVSFDAVTQHMDAAVIPDNRPHVSQLEITPMLEDGSTGAPVMIDEGNQLAVDNRMPGQVAPVDAARVEELHGVVGQMIEGVDPALRAEGSNAEQSSENEKERKDDDQNKALPPGGGNDGGGNGGGNGPGAGNGPQSGNDLKMDTYSESKVDSMMDNMIPREDLPGDQTGAGNAGTNPGGPDQRDRNVNSNSSTGMDSSKTENSGTDRKPQMDQVMRFAQVGGAGVFNTDFEGEGSGDHNLNFLVGQLENWGVKTEDARAFTDLIETPDTELGTGGHPTHLINTLGGGGGPMIVMTPEGTVNVGLMDAPAGDVMAFDPDVTDSIIVNAGEVTGKEILESQKSDAQAVILNTATKEINRSVRASIADFRSNAWYYIGPLLDRLDLMTAAENDKIITSILASDSSNHFTKNFIGSASPIENFDLAIAGNRRDADPDSNIASIDYDILNVPAELADPAHDSVDNYACTANVGTGGITNCL